MMMESEFNNIQILDQLERSGQLKKLVNGGIISPKVYTYVNIYNDVIMQMSIKNINKQQAVLHTADKFSVTIRTVHRAISSMK